jgi:hypothetical protein
MPTRVSNILRKKVIFHFLSAKWEQKVFLLSYYHEEGAAMLHGNFQCQWKS